MYFKCVNSVYVTHNFFIYSEKVEDDQKSRWAAIHFLGSANDIIDQMKVTRFQEASQGRNLCTFMPLKSGSTLSILRDLTIWLTPSQDCQSSRDYIYNLL